MVMIAVRGWGLTEWVQETEERISNGGAGFFKGRFSMVNDWLIVDVRPLWGLGMPSVWCAVLFITGFFSWLWGFPYGALVVAFAVGLWLAWALWFTPLPYVLALMLVHRKYAGVWRWLYSDVDGFMEAMHGAV